MKALNKKMAKSVCGFLMLTLLFLHPGISYSQFVVQTGYSPQELVENILLGNGVSVSNIHYHGSPLSIGGFTHANSSILGMTNGIMLSTGRVVDLAGANTVPNRQYNTQGGSDPQLQSLIPLYNIYDAAVLEFDFIPTTDSIRFNFVFGSEEYSEWVGSGFNDVFGFFISGPNPIGGQYNNKNIALIPGTTIPISTNTINNGVNNLGPCTNCNYYIDNTGGTSLQLDGLTTKMEARINVIPCQVYHIKIAIGDGSDHSYDSGVFLEGNSFTSIGLHINAGTSSSNGNTINEGCDSAAIDFILSRPLNFDYWVPITLAGSAQNNIDFTHIPDSILIPAGIDSVRLNIVPILDTINEATESISCIIPISSCTNDTVQFNISNYNLLNATIIGDSIFCQQDQISLTAGTQGGIGPYHYQWGQGNTNPQLNFPAIRDTSIQLTSTDACGNSITTQKTITVHPSPVIHLSSSIDSVCKGETTTLIASGSTNYSWYKNNVLLPGQHTDSLLLPITANTTIKVSSSNSYGCTSSNSKNLVIFPTITLSASPTLNTICENDTAHFILSGANRFIWPNLPIITHNPNYSEVSILPSYSDTFWVKGINSYSCLDSVRLSILIQANPILSISSTYDTLCSNMSTSLTAYGALNYHWLNDSTLNRNYGANVIAQPSHNQSYYVEGSNLQGCSSIDSISLFVYQKPNVQLYSSKSKICNGDTIKINASGTNFYYWLSEGQVLAYNQNYFLFSPSHSSQISAVGVDVFGCSDTVSKLIRVMPEFNIKLSDSIVCSNTNTLVNVESNERNLSYHWNNGSTLAQTKYRILSQQQIMVTVTNEQSCSSVDSATIAVFPHPNISLRPLHQTICLGDTAMVSVDNSEGLSIQNWTASSLWQSPNNDTILLSPRSSIHLNIKMKDNNGCLVSANQEAEITINPLPTIAISPHYVEVQAMSPYTLNVSGGQQYIWDPVAPVIIAGAHSLRIATDTLTHFHVMGTDSNGCVNYDTAIVNPRPQLKVITNHRKICYGDSTYITALTNVYCTYNWSNGIQQQGQWVKPTQNTNYSVNVVDSLGFTNSGNINIIVYHKPRIMTTPSPVRVCNGESRIINAYGAKYYTWLPATNLNKNHGSRVITYAQNNTTYKLIGIDKFGCSDTINVPVTIVPDAAIHINTLSTTICQGEEVSLSGYGASGYTYEWKPGCFLNDSLNNAVIAKPTESIIYQLIGTNSYGCKDTLESKIIVKTSPKVNFYTHTSDICLGKSVNLSVYGADNFQWLRANGLRITSNSTATVKPYVTTIYTVVGTNNNGCTDSTLTPIRVHAYPNININPTTTQVCPNDSAVLTAVGASTYIWYPNIYLDTNRGPRVISKADTSILYRVIGKNQYGCADTAVSKLNILPLSEIHTATRHLCQGDSVLLSAYSNTSNTNYLWNNGSHSAQQWIQPMQSQWVHLRTNLINTNCFSDTSIYIEVEANPLVSITASKTLSCPGDTIKLEASGANIYTWSSSDSNSSSFNGSMIRVFPNHNTSFIVEGMTLSGCTDTAQININTFTAPTVNVSPDFTQICSGSSQLLQASGASHYNWYPTIGLSNNHGDSVIVIPNTNMTYMVVGFDSNACSDTAYAHFTTWTPATITPMNPSICFGDSITLHSTSQNVASSYLWNTGDTTTSINIAPLQSSTYQLTLTYGSGCSKISNTTINVYHDSTVSLHTVTPQICLGDTAIIMADNGAYFNWFGSNIIKAVDSSLFVTPQQAGWYKVIANSRHHCSSEDSIFINLYAGPSISLSSSRTEVCSGDSILLSAGGGLTYQWLNPNNGNTTAQNVAAPINNELFQVIGYDYNHCRDTAGIMVQTRALPSINISPGNISTCIGDSLLITIHGNDRYSWINSPSLQTLNNHQVYLFPDRNTLYTLMATDSFGCIRDTTIRCDVKRQPINYFSTDANPICQDDTVKITAIGAENYQWQDIPVKSSLHNDTVFYRPHQSMYYKISGISTDGCIKTDSLLVNVAPKPNLIISSNKNTYCQGDSAILIGYSSITNCEYRWNTNDTNSNIALILQDTSNFTLSAITPQGCQSNISKQLIVYQRPNISVNITDTTLCQGDSILLEAIGIASYHYQWSGGDSTATLYANSNDSLYQLIVTDSNSCSDTATARIHTHALPIISIQANANPICINDSCILTASYSDSSLQLLWNTGSHAPQIASSATHSLYYSLIATDSLGCSSIDSIMVTVNPAPQFTFNPSSPEICNDDSIILNIVSNSSNLNLEWGVGDTVSSIKVVPNQNTQYLVTAYDSIGCSKTDSIKVIVHQLPTIAVGVIPSILCKGDTATISTNASPSFTSYQWNTGDNTNTIRVSPDSTSTYSITISDTNSCSNSAQITLRVADLPLVSIHKTDSVICSYDTLGLWLISNSPLMSIQWNTGQTTDSIVLSPLQSNSYQVRILDSNGCKGYDSTYIQVNHRPSCRIMADTSICLNDSSIARYQGNAASTALYNWHFEGQPMVSGTGQGPIGLRWFQSGIYKIKLQVYEGGCFSFPDSLNIHINDLPDVDFSVKSMVHCDSTAVQFVNTNYNNLQYHWNFGDPLSTNDTSNLQNPSYVYSVPGSYSVSLRLINQAGCSAGITKNSIVTVFPKPHAEFRVNTLKPDENHPVVNFYNYSKQYTHLLWNFGEPQSGIYNTSTKDDPYHIYIGKGKFLATLIVNNTYNCSDTTMATIEIDNGPSLFSPGAFTPNGDGLNDLFTPVFSDNHLKSFKLYVYNRLGSLVYQSNNYHQYWAGRDQKTSTNCEADIYNYIIYIVDSKNVRRKYTGSVTLLR